MGNKKMSKEPLRVLAEAMMELKKMHSTDHPKAKFKMGQRVQVLKDGLVDDFGRINMVNWADDNEDGSPMFEYGVTGHMYLFWENDLKGE